MQDVASAIGRSGIKSTVKLGRKVASRVGKMALYGAKSILKIVISVLLPYLVYIVIILIIFLFLYASIFLLPKFMTNKMSENNNSDFSIIFGYNKNDDDWNEDKERKLYAKYNSLCDSYDDGLTDYQIEQVTGYKLSWAILAAIDRLLAEPIFTGSLKRMPNPEKHYEELKPIFTWESYAEKNYTSYEYL